MNEIWKVVPEIIQRNGSFKPDKYEVSNLGRVRTKKQRYGKPRKDTGKRADLSEYRYLSGRNDGVGYIQYELYDAESNRKNIRGHVLVMQAFVGAPGKGQVVCHYDDVKNNNQLTNLRYDTQKANLADMVRNKLSNSKISDLLTYENM
jgi:hypothetical protein